jgi:DNA-binding NarL/FixJ family response regulator
MPLPSTPPRGVESHFAPPAGSPQPQTQPVRVLIADAHCCVREGLKALVNAQPDMRVVGETADGPEAVRLAAELAPDVVVVEASLPGLDGAEVAARLCAAQPGLKTVALTACEEPGAVRRLLAAGACGYVLKRATAEQLVQALRAVVQGGTYIDPAVAGGVAGEFAAPPDGGEARGAELSERECAVVRLIALGYSNKEIAARLKVSVKTVETYKARAAEKLRIKSRVELVRYAARRGWLAEAELPETPPSGPARQSPSARLERGTAPDGSGHSASS